jgi:MFS family permease
VSLRRHPDFLKLWAGETISVLGSQVTLLAIPFIAITLLDASTFQVGLLTAVEMSPFLLVGLPAGAIVDRLPRRPVLIAADAGRALALASIPLAHHWWTLTMAQLYVVVLITGVLTVFFDVAYQSYLPALVERDQLVEGNSKLEISRSGSQIAGPGMAGGLVGAVGPVGAIVVDAVSFVLSGFAVLAIRGREPRRRADDEARPRIRTDIAEGLRYVLGHRYLRNIAGATATFNLFGSMQGAVLLVFAVRELDLSAGRVGLVLAIGNIGFLLGAVVVGRFTRWLGLGPAIVWSAVVCGIGPWLAPLATKGLAMPLLIASGFVTGVGVPIYNINQVSLRQAITPDRLLGRMNATMRFMVWGTMPLGGLLGGVVGTRLGLRPAMFVAAGGASLAFLWVLFSPVARLREIPGPEAGSVDGEEAGDALPGVGGIVGPVGGALGVVDESVAGFGVDDDLDVR